MIKKIKVRGYRIYKDFCLIPDRKLNLLVGANEAGKSTLMEAIALALTGRIGGRSASEDLNPYWFNTEIVAEFLHSRANKNPVALPEIHIELFFEDRSDLQRLCGAVNSDIPTNACPGISMRIIPNPDYSVDIDEWLKSPTHLLPVEYYTVDWRSFADEKITERPRQLATAIIDSRTVRSSSGVDYHLRQILSDHMEPVERAAVSLAYRTVKASMSKSALVDVNNRIGTINAALHEKPIALAMDQSSRTSWENVITPHVNDVPFSMSGQGQQAAIKISLAMNRHSGKSNFVMIEEPENHLTHTSLSVLLNRIQSLASNDQQLFITTHSSFVLNRLGLNSLVLLGGGSPCRISGLSPDTVSYFQKLPGYDTLRIALANKVVLVEGPSDEIIFERIFKDKYGCRPIEFGIDVISMRGLSLKRCLELCAALDKNVVALRDNDGYDPSDLRQDLSSFLKVNEREVFIGDVSHGKTLEPQIMHYNDEKTLRSILSISNSADLATWMQREKTESALRIAASLQNITPPKYIADAVEFIHG